MSLLKFSFTILIIVVFNYEAFTISGKMLSEDAPAKWETGLVLRLQKTVHEAIRGLSYEKQRRTLLEDYVSQEKQKRTHLEDQVAMLQNDVQNAIRDVSLLKDQLLDEKQRRGELEERFAIMKGDLACLLRKNVSGLQFETSADHFSGGEQCCFSGRVRVGLHRAKPDQLNEGRDSRVGCEQIQRGLADIGLSTLRQRCCSTDVRDNNTRHPQPQRNTISAVDTTQSSGTFVDCWDLQTRGGFNKDGEYDIHPAPAKPRLRVRCDMTTDGGGWTVLQKRYDGSLNFTRTFQEYEDGFGDVSAEYWLGLKMMHVLTTREAMQMRVDLCAFDGSAGYALYDGFKISGASDTYRLKAGTYRTGSIQNRLRQHNDYTFKVTDGCALWRKGGWWNYGSICGPVALNGGKYNGGTHNGIVWYNFGGSGNVSLKSSDIKIRPIHVTGGTSRPYTCPL